MSCGSFRGCQINARTCIPLFDRAPREQATKLDDQVIGEVLGLALTATIHWAVPAGPTYNGWYWQNEANFV